MKMAANPNNKKRGNWILWWQIDPIKFEEQVSGYHSLSIIKSARGISFLLLILSGLITFLFYALFKSQYFGSIDAIVGLFLGLMIYRGHRWAMIGAMIFWSIEKAFLVVNGPTGTDFIGQFIWWALYMHYFYLASQVQEVIDKKNQEEVPVLEDTSS